MPLIPKQKRGFPPTVLRTLEKLVIKIEINANVCFNKRNRNSVGREEYFDQDLHNHRYAVECISAWIDSFRLLLNRFYTAVERI